jgi:hypothetical protein
MERVEIHFRADWLSFLVGDCVDESSGGGDCEGRAGGLDEETGSGVGK